MSRCSERNGEGLATVVESTINVTVASVCVRLRFSYERPTGLRWTRESGDLRSLDGWWRFEERDGLTVATYGLEIGVSRRLSVVVRTIRGPLRHRLEALLGDSPVEGLKAQAESQGQSEDVRLTVDSPAWSGTDARPRTGSKKGGV